MNAVSNKDLQSKQAGPRVDLKPVQQPCASAEYASLKRERFKQSQAAKEASPANKRKEPEEIFEEAAKPAEQTQPAVTVAPVAKEAPVDIKSQKVSLTRQRTWDIMTTKKMVLENNKRIQVVRIKRTKEIVTEQQ